MILFFDFFKSKRKNHLHMADINHANSMKNMYILVFLRTIFLDVGAENTIKNPS